MGNRVVETPRGLGIPKTELISLATLVDSAASSPPPAAESFFTEAAPRPGSMRPDDAQSRLLPVLSRNQVFDTQVEVVKSGSPFREGGEEAYRLVSEAATEDRGWTPPNLLHHFSAAEFTDAETFDLFQCALIPSTQKVVAVYKRLSDGLPFASVWSPDTQVWSTPVSITAGLGVGGGNHASVVVLPENERILAMAGAGGTIFASDDVGVTWRIYANAPLGVTLTLPPTGKRDRMAVTPDGEIVLFHNTAAVPQVVQYASSDLGATWSLIDTSTIGGIVDCAAFSDGSIAVATTGEFRRLGSPFEPASNAAAIVTTSIGFTSCWVDADDVVYIASMAASQNMDLRRSIDLGATWTDFTFNIYASGDISTGPTNLGACATKGGALILHNWITAPGAFDGSLGAMLVGGWSNLEPGVVSTVAPTVPTRESLAGDGVLVAQTWTPLELPSNITGWALTGSAGTLVAPGEHELISAASTDLSTFTLGTQATESIISEWRTDSFTAGRVGFTLRLSDGVNSSEVQVDLTTTALNVVDLNTAGSLLALPITGTANLQVYCRVVGRTVLNVFTRRAGTSNWTLRLSTTLDFTGVAVLGRIEKGHVAAGFTTATSHWIHFSFSESALLGLNDPVQFGKAITGLSYPVPDLLPAGGEFAFMSVTAGPGTVGETYQIEAAHDFGVDQMFPLQSPSQDARWRSTSTADEIIFVWNFVEAANLGKVVFVAALGINFRTFFLDQSPDGITWTVEGQYDGAIDFSGLSFVRAGKTVRPATTGGDADRFLFQNEVAGGHIQLDLTTARHITQSEAGAWSPNAATGGTVAAELTIETTGGEPASGTEARIVAPAGVLFIQNPDPANQYWRIRIPAAASGNPIPDDFFEIGALVVGSVRPYGQEPDWTWTWSVDLNADTETSAYGTTRTRELGPPPRSLTVNWSQAVDITGLRSGIDPDFYSIEGGVPLTAKSDVFHLLWGLVEELESGEIPVLGLPLIPTFEEGEAFTITDRSLFVYGRVSTGSITANSVVGNEGVDEVFRLPAFTISEIR